MRALQAFQERFPTVPPRIYVESLSGVARLIIEGTCPLGVMVGGEVEPDVLRRVPLVDIEMVIVAAPVHPLARLPGRLTPEMLRDHTQLVLTDRSAPSGGRDYGVYAVQTWRLADLSAKHALLRAGLGFGGMPLHMVSDDLREGRLVRLELTEWEGSDRPPSLPICAAYRGDTPLGPATHWMLDHLVAQSREHGPASSREAAARA